MIIEIIYATIFGLIAKLIAQKINIPPLIGMLIIGIIIGPYNLGVLSVELIEISGIFRTFALMIILCRVAISLDFYLLKKVGISTVLLCFVPALFEMLAISFIAVNLFDIQWIDSFLLATVVAAVSPAVVVPSMFHVIKEGYGVKKGIPQMILASASFDDIIVMLFFSAFLSIASSSGSGEVIVLSSILSIVFSLIFGLFIAKVLSIKPIKTPYILFVILAVCGLLFYFESNVGYSSLLVIIVFVYKLTNKREDALQVAKQFSSIWEVAQIYLFVFIGGSVNPMIAVQELSSILLLLAGGLFFRMLGVYLSVLFSDFNFKEKLFCMISFIPKATVQASIGAIPLNLNLSSGQLILAVAVVVILVSAPIGALCIQYSYKRLLCSETA